MTIYAIFAGHTYYALGGWYDLQSTFDSNDIDFKSKLKKKYDTLKKTADWIHIVNLQKGIIVKHWGNGHSRLGRKLA